ncbi:scarecrow-like protein 3 [Senna tora]|uniref:Scarecrow-like protein 3 n=1 Tax=Senna tora TaxID=362788 RepID=A0A834X247_9FABA|nr:scarecrow-like protein 3 [Senna tora]
MKSHHFSISNADSGPEHIAHLASPHGGDAMQIENGLLLSRTSVERKKVEKMVLGGEISNIVACEGVERDEKLEKWITWCRQLVLQRY